MTTSDALDRARESYGRKAWSDAYAQFTAADQESPLEPADLERLATAAYLLGRDDDSADIWARTYHELLRRGDPERAARCALWLASGLMPRGELARAGAWVARARGLLDDGERDCVEQGYLLVMTALQHLIEGDAEAASTIFGRAAEVGDRFDEPHLPALARLFWGQALLMLGQTAPPTPPAPSSSPRATSAPPLPCCAVHGRPGRRWTCPTKAPASGSCSGWPAGSSGTRTARRWSWTRRAGSSSSSAPCRSWPGWRRSPGRRPPGQPAG
jgi:hypothetical protein